MIIECHFMLSNGFEKIEDIEFSDKPSSTYRFRRFITQPPESAPIYEDIFLYLEEYFHAHKKKIAYYMEE